MLDARTRLRMVGLKCGGIAVPCGMRMVGSQHPSTVIMRPAMLSLLASPPSTVPAALGRCKLGACVLVCVLFACMHQHSALWFSHLTPRFDG